MTKMRKRENQARKTEEKIIFLYFCTQKVKYKGGKSKPKKRKSSERTKLKHIRSLQWVLNYKKHLEDNNE